MSVDPRAIGSAARREGAEGAAGFRQYNQRVAVRWCSSAEYARRTARRAVPRLFSYNCELTKAQSIDWRGIVVHPTCVLR